MITCKICAENMSFHDTALVLNKYTATYYRCPHCGFIQTEEPYWLNEAYSKAITTADTGIMSRNISNVNMVLFFIKFIHNTGGGGGIKCMDFGGGHGIFTRMMRDYGFDFYHYDKYAENLFAAGFEADTSSQYTLITAFENFEHFVNPLAEIKNLLDMTDTLFFSTELVPTPVPPVKDWWYYAPSTGQHISFYTSQTLQFIARKYDVHLLSNNKGIHVLSKAPVRKNFFQLLRLYDTIRNKLDVTRKLKKESKTWNDMLSVLKINEKEGITL